LITLKPSRVDYRNNYTPILSNNEIDEFAEAVLADYKPQLLRDPGALNFQLFLESYLDVTLIFKDIFNEDETKPIFGVVAFRDGTLKVFDRENERISNFFVWHDTVLIDNYVMKPGREGLATFTGLHEASHYLLHQGVYRVEHKKHPGTQEGRLSGIVFCRRDTVESFGSGGSVKERTAKQWREYQADYCASALAMPNATFIPLVNEYMLEHKIYKRNVILGQNEDWDILAKDLLPEHLAEIYGVSKRAAFIKLKKGGFVAGV
jgi:Zn-dependent peptidase ImmA (M78 family)